MKKYIFEHSEYFECFNEILLWFNYIMIMLRKCRK